jgi:hypothetical protein
MTRHKIRKVGHHLVHGGFPLTKFPQHIKNKIFPIKQKNYREKGHERQA